MLANLPILIWMLYTYFKEIPVDILEAARMDGASLVNEIVYVLTPMAVPGIASTMLLAIILSWNEAFWTLNLTTSNAAPLTAFIASYSARRACSGPSSRPPRRSPSRRSSSSAGSRRSSSCAASPSAQSNNPAIRNCRPWAAFNSRTCARTSAPSSVINGVNLKIEDGEFAVFVGPSGCGKSTLLRLIAGLEDITSGQILIDGKDVTNVGPAQRGLAMVFQSYALYPHMSVRGNIAFALKMAGQKPPT